MASNFYPWWTQRARGRGRSQLASLADRLRVAPRGAREELFGLRRRSLEADHVFWPFTATTRMSGWTWRATDPKGAGNRSSAGSELAARPPSDLDEMSSEFARRIDPLVVADGGVHPGCHRMKDVVKSRASRKVAEMRSWYSYVMITGDNR